MGCSQYSTQNNEKKIDNPYNVKQGPETLKQPEINPFIKDSDLKLNSNISKLVRISRSFDKDTKLKRGIYKLVYNVPEVGADQHITNVAKAVKSDGDFTDIFFYKVDFVKNENDSGSTITAIFEIPDESTFVIPVSYIIYVIGIAIVGFFSSYTITRLTSLINVVGDILPWLIGALIVFGFIKK